MPQEAAVQAGCTNRSTTRIESITERGMDFISLAEQIDTTTPGGKLIFHLMGPSRTYELKRRSCQPSVLFLPGITSDNCQNITSRNFNIYNTHHQSVGLSNHLSKLLSRFGLTHFLILRRTQNHQSTHLDSKQCHMRK